MTQHLNDQIPLSFAAESDQAPSFSAPGGRLDVDDSLLIAGAHPYQRGAVETDTRILRAIIGGTGAYMGAHGQMVSERLESSWYRHSIWLVDDHRR